MAVGVFCVYVVADGCGGVVWAAQTNFFEKVVTDYSKGLDMGDGSFETGAKF